MFNLFRRKVQTERKVNRCGWKSETIKINISDEEHKSNILQFIDTFVDYGDDSIKIYTQGYCYYFAQILKSAFPGGDICWNTYAHFVYVYRGKAYDILGEVTGDYCFIPEKYLGKFIDNFKHNNNETPTANKQDILDIINSYLKENDVDKETQTELIKRYS